MKRLLLVSYGFPPVSRVQSQGAGKLAAGLARRGWEVHALTVADPPTFLFDETLTDELPVNVTTHTAYSLEPTRALQWLRGLRRGLARERTGESMAQQPKPTAPPPEPERSYTSLPQPAVKLLRALFFPDEKIGWAPFAVREAHRLHGEEPFDAVVSTGPPYTAHVIARRFARRTGVPWLAVLMDPVVGCYAFPPVTPVHAWLARRLESQIARDAAAITTATRPWADALVSRNPSAATRVSLLPNGFDPNDFPDEPMPLHEGFCVAYVGTFQLSIKPDTFLDAVARLLADPDMARDLRISFVGPRDPDTEAALTARGLSERVERTGLVPHGQAVRRMRQADVLLFVLGPEPESADILTGKLPEYLASGAAVIAEAPEGVATDVVRRSGAGLVCRPGDREGMANALSEQYNMWRDGRLPAPAPNVVAEFNRDRALDRLTATLATILKDDPDADRPS
ncbi:MAG: glycosyltransferase [Coriobacteriia bacterium]|nr:glycosyltransferase [Coriobacteriia bacterium]